jgi:hypothetical protein
LCGCRRDLFRGARSLWAALRRSSQGSRERPGGAETVSSGEQGELLEGCEGLFRGAGSVLGALRRSRRRHDEPCLGRRCRSWGRILERGDEGGLGDWGIGGLGDWSVGALERWSVGALEDWSVGGLERWRIGGLEDWRIGGLEDWRIGGSEDRSRRFHWVRVSRSPINSISAAEAGGLCFWGVLCAELGQLGS